MPIVQGVDLQLPAHVTLRTSFRKFFVLPLASVWETLCETIPRLQESEDFRLHAAVVMSNHFHMVLTPPEFRKARWLEDFTRDLTSALRLKIGHPEIQFALSANMGEIRHPHYFGRTLRYIYRNPVSAGLCARVEDYPFSTIHALLERENSPLPLHETYFSQIIVPRDREELLRWLNSPAPYFWH